MSLQHFDPCDDTYFLLIRVQIMQTTCIQYVNFPAFYKRFFDIKDHQLLQGNGLAFRGTC